MRFVLCWLHFEHEKENRIYHEIKYHSLLYTQLYHITRTYTSTHPTTQHTHMWLHVTYRMLYSICILYPHGEYLSQYHENDNKTQVKTHICDNRWQKGIIHNTNTVWCYFNIHTVPYELRERAANESKSNTQFSLHGTLRLNWSLILLFYFSFIIIALFRVYGIA